MRSDDGEPDENQPDDARGDGPAGGGQAGGIGEPHAGDLTRMVARVRAAERELAQAVVLAGRLAGSGVAEAEAGQPLEQVLLVACRLTGADRHTLVIAGELLAHMPQLRALFLAGEVSWGQVRGICHRAKRLSRSRLAWLDARLAATLQQRGVAGVDPDELVDAAGDAIAELFELDRVERDERQGVAESFLSIQPDFFGGVRAYGEFDAQVAAPVLDALQAASPPPHAGQAAHGHRGDQHHGGDGGKEHGSASAPSSGWSGPSRSRQHAQGLWRIASEWLAGQPVGSDGAAAGDPRGDGAGDGGPVTGRKARPQLVVHATLAEARAALAGTVDLAARGPLPRLTAAAVDALACTGEVQAVVFDGARPLAATAKVTAADVPSATRQAIEARDRQCRWPGCRAPLAHTEIHHLLAASHGGDHHPENLVCLCRVHHLQAHTRGWTLQLDGETGALAGHRHGCRRWTSHPPATPLAHPTAPSDDSSHTAGGGHSNDPAAQRDPPTDGASPDGRDPPDDEPDTDHHGNPLPF